jgi:NAD(P)-dependent dehydrogenase (short-subunit alcohol dehydrogenase family)
MSGENLANRVALISGAARGIGEAEARTLIEAGANVVLINNAGVPGRHGVEEISETEWHRLIRTDLMSAWLGMKLDGRTTHDRLILGSIGWRWFLHFRPSIYLVTKVEPAFL